MKKELTHSITRYIKGIYTEQDANTLFESLKSDTGYQELADRMDHEWTGINSWDKASEHHDAYKKEAKSLLVKIQPKKKTFNIWPLMKYASVFLLLLLSGFGIYQYYTVYSNPTVYTALHISKGEKKQIILSDGTKVILNAGSYLRYPSSFAGEKQRVIEMNGEGFFEVKRDESKPFIVQTKDASVKVLGTSFNMKAYDSDEQISVSVQTGKVQVDVSDAMTRLLPNEQLMYDRRNGEFHKRNEDVKRVTSWIKGGLYFNRTPIYSVIKELERIYDCEIEFAPGDKYEEYIYGEHDNKNLEAVLKSIQYSTGIKYKMDGTKITLSK